MTVSTIAVADAGSPDKYLHTEQRTISSTSREDQYVQLGESAYPTYVASASASLATVDDHLIQVMADGTNYCRVKRISIQPTSDIPASASAANFDLVRLTSAGTGGGSITCDPFDTSGSYGGAAQSLPSSKGTIAVAMHRWYLALPGSLGDHFDRIEWTAMPGAQPIIFGPDTSKGIAIKSNVAVASCSVQVFIEFTVTSYL